MKLIVNNSLTKVESDNNYIHNRLYDCLSYQDKDILYLRNKSKKYYIDPTKSFYNKKQHFFLTGLLRRVTEFLEDNEFEYSIEDLRKNEDIVVYPHDIVGIEYYDYQEEAIQTFCKAKRGVLKLATSAGKTIIGKGIVKSIRKPTLWLTHRTQLLYQTAKRFENRLPELKGKFGIIGDGEFSPNYITFAMAQTVFSMLKTNENDIKKLLSAFSVVIVDECHRMGADSFSKVVEACVNAEYRCGLSGTPFMRNDQHEDMSLIGGIGETIVDVDVKTLVDAGVVAKPIVHYTKILGPENIKHLREYREVYNKGIIENKERNDVIVKTTLEALKTRKHILSIVNNIKHGDILLKMYKDAGIRCSFCTGSMSSQDRDYELRKLSDGELDLVIATTIFDEGLSVNEIDCIVLCGAGKSAPANLQRAGRGLRIKEKDNTVLILDYYDCTHRILSRHSKMRYNIFKNNEGFEMLNKEKTVK